MRPLTSLLLGVWLLLGCGGEPPVRRAAVTSQEPTSSPAATSNSPARETNAPVTPSVPQSGPSSPDETARSNSEPVYHLSRAQVGLPTVDLYIGAHILQAEVCVTLTQIATGLMFRDGISEDEGMLFAFRTPRQRSFYMRNVPFPIAAAYLDAEGVIQEIVQLKAFDESPVDSKSGSIQYVLETAPDWFERRNIGPGTLIVTDKGSLGEVFGRIARLP